MLVPISAPITTRRTLLLPDILWVTELFDQMLAFLPQYVTVRLQLSRQQIRNLSAVFFEHSLPYCRLIR